jgi:Intracellular proteinase inhibitor
LEGIELPGAFDPETGIELRLKVWPQPLRSPGPVRWTFHLRNAGHEPVTLAFRSSQLGEVILEKNGDQVYQWGRDKMFATILEERSLTPGATWSFALEDVLEVEATTYRLEALLPAYPDLPRVRASIVVESA